MKKLVKLQETISHLRTKLTNNAREYEERSGALREEKEAIQSHFQELKRKMNVFREGEKERLTELTILSNRIIKSLKTKVEKAEKILKLAEMNRKLETEEEKVVPFYELSIDGEILKKEELLFKNVQAGIQPSSEHVRLFSTFSRCADSL